jgi:micrococcal nuclease
VFESRKRHHLFDKAIIADPSKITQTCCPCLGYCLGTFGLGIRDESARRRSLRRAVAFVLASLSVGAASAPVVCKGTVCKSTGSFSRWQPAATRATPEVGCPSAFVVDGDTLRCGRVRVRLLGIDAPEIERCPRHRVCAPGDGQAAKQSLIAALRFGSVGYQPVTHDRYGRTVAVVRAGDVNLSCWQLEQRQAIYKPQWDNGGAIERACR